MSVDDVREREYMNLIMSDFLNDLRAELRELELAVRNDPRHQKIAAIKQLLALYGSSSMTGVAAPLAPPVRERLTRPPETAASKVTNVRREVAAFVHQHRPNPVHRKDLLQHLTAKGIMGHEKDPMKSLAIYLSDMPGIESVGSGYWRLQDQALGLGLGDPETQNPAH